MYVRVYELAVSLCQLTTSNVLPADSFRGRATSLVGYYIQRAFQCLLNLNLQSFHCYKTHN